MFKSLIARPLILATTVSALMSLPAYAADMISKVSPHSVPVTIDRLSAAVEGAGATIFARVDHAAGAAKVDMDLRPTELLIFGNPKLGTPAMLDGQTAGLDLPLRVLAYADGEGVVHITYHDPAGLVETHGLPADAKYLAMMTGALDKLTSKAIAEE
jgi:uncharacterized protein (DUF302 family)